MKKLGLSLFLVLMLALFASAGEKPGARTIVFHTDIGVAAFNMDSSTSDTSYFAYPNPKLDSMIVYFRQYSAAGTSETSCDIQTTPDDISMRFSDQVDTDRSKSAVWTKTADVFTDITTESTTLYYGITDSIAMAKPALYARIILANDGSSNPDNLINRLGVLVVPKTR